MDSEQPFKGNSMTTGIVSPGQLEHALKAKLKKQYYHECLMILEACNGNGTEAIHRLQDALKAMV